MHDGAAAYAFATRLYAPERIVLWGESLGTGIVVALAAEYPVGRVLLESPYTSIADIAAEAYPFAPARLLTKDRFRSDKRIGNVSAPVLVVHGTDDDVVPIRYGERLYAMIRAPKRFVRIDGGGHNDQGEEEQDQPQKDVGGAQVTNRFLLQSLVLRLCEDALARPVLQECAGAQRLFARFAVEPHPALPKRRAI